MKKFPNWQKVSGITIISIIVISGLIYLLRVQLFGPVIENVAQTRIESSLGSGGDYSIGKVEGSYIKELRIQNVNLQPPPDSGLQEIRADEIVVRYNPFEFLGSNPVAAVKSITANGLLVRINPSKSSGTLGAGAQPQAGGTNPGALIAGLTTQLPEDLSLNADGRLIVDAQDGQYTFPFDISGNTGKEVRINAGTPEGLIPWTLPVLLLTTGNGSFKLTSEDPQDTAAGNEVPVISLSADTETTAQGETRLSAAAAEFTTNDIRLNLDAQPRNISVQANLSAAGTAKLKTLLKKLTGGLPDLSLGTLKLDLNVNSTDNAPDGFLDYLLRNPVPAQAYLSGGGTFSARGWRYNGIPVDSASGNLQWKDKLIEIDNFRLIAEGIFTVTAGSLLVDPQQNFLPVNLDQLDFRVQNAVKFLNLLRSGNAPFLEQLSGGGTSLLETSAPQRDLLVPVSFTPSHKPAAITTAFFTGTNGSRSPRIIRVQSNGGSTQPQSGSAGDTPQLPFEDLPLNVTTSNISFKQGKLIIGTFSASAGNAFELTVKNLSIVPGNAFLPTGLDRLELHLRDPAALSELLQQTGGAPQALSLFQSADIVAAGKSDELAIRTFDVRLNGASVTAGGSFRFPADNPLLRFDLSQFTARLDHGEFTGAASGSIDLTDFSGNTLLSRLEGSYTVGKTEYPVKLGEATRVTWNDTAVSAAVNGLEALGGTLGVTFNSGDRLSAKFSLENVSLPAVNAALTLLQPDAAPVFLQNASGSFTVTGNYSGTLPGQNQQTQGSGSQEAPVFAVRLTTENLKVNGRQGKIQLAASQSAEGLRLSTLDGNLGDLVTFTGGGLLPLVIDTGGIRIVSLEKADFALSAQATALQTLLPPDTAALLPEVSPDLRLSFDRPSGKADLFIRLRDTAPTPAPGQPEGPAIEVLPYREFQLRAAVDGFTTGTWKISASILTEQNTLLNGNFTFDIGKDWKLATLTKAVLTAPVSGSAKFQVPLERLSPFIPNVERISGIVEGGVTPGGTLANPILNGSISLSETNIRLQTDVPSISSLQGKISFRNNAFTVDSLNGFLGHAPFNISGGIDISRKGEIQTADLSITGTNILLMRNPDLRVRADTDLSIKGKNDQLTVSGNVAITDALYSKQIPLFSLSSAPSVDSQMQLFSVRGKLGRNTALDVRITADKTVRLDTNLYRGSFSLDLRLQGTAAVPLPVGRVFTDQGRVMLPFSSLSVTNARVLFTETNPFTPVIEARAQTAMQNYNLFVTVSGPLPELQVNVTSSPPLPPDQAILLLTTGSSTFDILSTSGALETGRTLGTYLSKQLLQRITGSPNPDESSFFDRLDIAVGKEISKAGRETITIEYRLGVGSPWYLIVERDRKDNYNIGVSWRLWFK